MYKLFISKKLSTKELLAKVLKKYNINSKILYNEYGKPYLENNELYFSLSDSKEYSVCVISDKNIGVDIEHITYKPNILKKICTEEELKLINNEEDFTKMWVKKESYVKFLGIGISYGLKNVDTLKLNIMLKKYKDYYIGIAM